MMQYIEVQPDIILNAFVQSFWQYTHTDGAPISHTILPDGYFDLIVEYQAGLLSMVKLTGIWTKPVDIVVQPSTEIIAVRFKLLAAEYLFSQQINQILDNVQYLPLDFWDIKHQVAGKLSNLIEIVQSQCVHLIANSPLISQKKLKLFELIYRNDELTVQQIEQQIAWDRRQINRYFNQQFGCSLKTILGIIRCRNAFQDIAKGKLSPQKEFFDQAHFIKSVKKHTGVTPKELCQNENDRFLQLSSLKCL